MESGGPRTERERYLAVLCHEQPDRIPFQPGLGRKSTLERWHKEGLPADVTDHQAYIRRQLGIPPATMQQEIRPVVNFRMIPQFEERVLEERPHSRIVQDWKGNFCEVGKEFGPTGLDGADFVTRSWLKCPVESRADWPDMARRYDADDPQRFPTDWVARGRQLANRDYPSGLVFPGPFWQLREWAEVCRAGGVPVYEVDSDGHVGTLIPVWIEAGFICNSPQEVAAGNDLPAYRRQFGTKMAYRGGVDKRAMAEGGATIRAEIARLKPAIDAGGCIPGCDHAVPADVAWPNFMDYCRLLAQVTGWL